MAPQSSTAIHVTHASKHESENPVIRILSSRLFKWLALPFPLSDSLYGLQPDSDEDFGAHLGAMATRGERGLLIVSIDALARMSSNPFFPSLMERAEQGSTTPAK